MNIKKLTYNQALSKIINLEIAIKRLQNENNKLIKENNKLKQQQKYNDDFEYQVDIGKILSLGEY